MKKPPLNKIGAVFLISTFFKFDVVQFNEFLGYNSVVKNKKEKSK